MLHVLNALGAGTLPFTSAGCTAKWWMPTYVVIHGDLLRCLPEALTLSTCGSAGHNISGGIWSRLQCKQQQTVWPAGLWGTAAGPLPASALPGPLPHEGALQPNNKTTTFHSQNSIAGSLPAHMCMTQWTSNQPCWLARCNASLAHPLPAFHTCLSICWIQFSCTSTHVPARALPKRIGYAENSIE